MSEARAVGIWIRVSTEDQARGESPENHKKRAVAYAELKEWQVIEVYDLSGVSGKSVMDHPECQRMLHDIQTKKIDALIFSKLARLARNTRELLDFSDIFKDCGADLISLSEAIDTSTPAGRLFFTMIAAMAQWEREEIVDRVRASIPIRAKEGKHIAGRAAFGYRWKGHELHLVEEEATVRRLMFDLFLKSRRFRTVARELNERGYRTRAGKLFSDSTVRRLLTDPMAKGMRRSNYTTNSQGTREEDRYKPESDWEWHPCPAIVDEEIWDQVQAIMLERQTNPQKRPTKKTKQLFSGIVKCHCGQKMYVRHKTKKYSCWVCANKIPKTDLEGVFVEQLKAFFFSDEEIAAFSKLDDTQSKAQARQLAVLHNKRHELQADMDELFRLHKTGEIPTKGFGLRYQPIEDQLTEIDVEIPRLQAAIDVKKINLQNRDYIVSEARSLYSSWTDLEEETKREIIETITEEIVIGKEDISIHLHYIPELHPPPFDPALLSASPPSQSDYKRATDSCRCGGGPAEANCHKRPRCQVDYQARLSGPFIDRIDLFFDTLPVTIVDLTLPPPAEGTEQVAARVAEARDIQAQRYGNAASEERRPVNADATPGELETFCQPDEAGEALLNDAALKLSLTARGYHRVLKVSRTIADLEKAASIRRSHIAEALTYRRRAPEQMQMTPHASLAR